MTAEKMKYVTAVMLYGTVGLFLHYIHLPSEIVVLCRGGIGTITILAVFSIQGRKIDFQAVKNNLWMLCLSGASLGLNWVFLFAAYRSTTVAVASLCNYMAPIIVIAISPFVFKEKLTFKKVCCISAAFLGIVLVSGVLEGGSGDFHVKGVLLGFAAALFFVAIILCNKHLHKIDPLEKTVVQLGVSALVALPYVIYTQHGESLTVDVLSCLLLLVLGILHTGIAYIMYFGAMGKIPVQSVAILGYLEPVVAVLTSALILREELTVMGVIGAALILGAAVYSELSQNSEQSQSNEASQGSELLQSSELPRGSGGIVKLSLAIKGHKK